MSSSGVSSNTGRAAMRLAVVASVMLSSGCAYFHPAFVTHPSRLQSANALGENGVLVCERLSLTRKDCTVMPRSEVNRILEELSH